MATTIVLCSSVSLSSGSKMSFLQLHSHPYALYLRRSHIPICVDNLTSSRLKNFLRLLLSVNKEFEEVTSNTHCLAVYMSDFYYGGGGAVQKFLVVIDDSSQKIWLFPAEMVGGGGNGRSGAVLFFAHVF